ncbi:MAG: hypothetical protein RL582_1472 [Bacteroidota bacterium]|jgi:TolA-binding protein
MSEQNTTFETVEALDQVKGFWEKNNKKIIYAGLAIILAISGWIGYQKFIVEPNEIKANEAIFPAENLFGKMATSGFNKDSVNIVLNGGEVEGTKILGLLKVMSANGGTKASNRASYMAGACYLHIGEFDKAIKYLADFSGNGADQIQAKAYLMMGHAYAEKNNVEEALNHYKKAGSVNAKDESVTPDALMTYAMYAEANGKDKEAVDTYKKIKDEYPTFVSSGNGDIDKRLARLGEFN